MPYWLEDDSNKSAKVKLAGVVALTLGTTGVRCRPIAPPMIWSLGTAASNSAPGIERQLRAHAVVVYAGTHAAYASGPYMQPQVAELWRGPAQRDVQLLGPRLLQRARREGRGPVLRHDRQVAVRAVRRHPRLRLQGLLPGTGVAAVHGCTHVLYGFQVSREPRSRSYIACGRAATACTAVGGPAVTTPA